MNAKFLIVSAITIVLLSCSDKDENDTFDIREVQGKNAQQIIKQLGEPDTSYYKNLFGKQYFVQQFKKYHHSEFKYYNGVLQSVTVTQPHPLEFDPKVITKFGLEELPPTSHDTAAFYLWKNFEDIKAVNVYLVGTKKPDSVKHNFKIYFNLKDEE